MDKKKKFIQIEIEGKDENLWAKMRSNLMKNIQSILDTTVDYRTNSSLKEEAQKFTSATLDFAKSKLNKAGFENEKIIAEVNQLITQREKEQAEARKTNAEAESIEIENKIKNLKLTLISYKFLLLGEQGEEEMLFLKNIDEFLAVIKVIEGNKLLI